MGWAAEELRDVRLGDKRREERLVRLVEALAAQPTASVPQACGDWAATKAAYRFWDSEAVTAEAIWAGHGCRVVERAAGQGLVLAVQDTTNLDFTAHAHVRELGYLDQPQRRGLKVHTALAVSGAGVPLGVLHQAAWVRPPQELGKSRRRRARPTAAKESQRWLTALEGSEAVLPAATPVLTVADREADIYALLARPRRAGSEVLVRAAHNRRVTAETRYLRDTLLASPVRGRLSLEVHGTPQRTARQATLTVRYAPVTVQPPRHALQRGALAAVPLQGILVQEEGAPAGEQPLEWLLLTSLPLPDLAAALQAVRWYSYRWLVERYHYALKSGCRLESLQLETGTRLRRALATYGLVAWRLLWLTYEARRAPQQCCETVLTGEEWRALYATHHAAPPPEEPPSLGEAVRWIAQLGGFLGRRGDGEPGVQTLWKGLRRLHDITATWHLLHAAPPGIVGKA